MTTVLCTLYNSLYLDKGLVLYDSLCECAKDFRLYVLCMDDKCYEVLTDLHQVNHIPIRLSDFEEGDKDLLDAKSNRPIGEYCWTCSSSLVRYVLNEYQESICTYIDADMYFYSDPQILINEMLAADKTVLVTPHRFPPKDEKLAKTVGTYCVEFNTFCNTPESLEVLEYWRMRCLGCCSNLGDGIHWGDQKYLEELVQKFNCVHVCQNKGAGVAPWNIILYKKEDMSIVFYHFQSVRYITRYMIDTNILTLPGLDLGLVDALYYPYLIKIEEKKKFFERRYGLTFLITHHPMDQKISRWKRILVKVNPIRLFSSLKSNLMHIHPYILKIDNCSSS